MSLEHHADPRLTAGEIRGIAVLLHAVWPEITLSPAEFTEKLRKQIAEATMASSGALYQRCVYWEGDTALAHAHTFPRTIISVAGPLRVLALAGVCTHPARRGEGLGQMVVRAAMQRVDNGEFPVALFQTGVPLFYERLGSRVVSNPFVNRRNINCPEATPWWDSHVIVYPQAADWPRGEIDLNGEGY